MTPDPLQSQINTPHDRFGRQTMSDPIIAADVLRHYADPVIAQHVDLDHLKPEPTQEFGKEFREFIKDISFVSHLIDDAAKSEVLIIAEHKSTPEPFVVLQLLTYQSFSWYRRWCAAGRPKSTANFRLPVSILIVLYTGDVEWTTDLTMKNLVEPVPAELVGFIPTVDIVQIHLNRFDVDNLPGSPETQAVVESMIRAKNGTFAANLEHIIRRLGSTSLDDRIRKRMDDIIRYCDLTEGVSPDLVDRAIKSAIKGQEGIEMSQTITKGIWTTGWEYGLTEGEARGEARGEIRGKAEGKADDVLRILSRQRGTVPDSLAMRVRTITDIGKLDQLFDLAFDCQSLDEFALHLS